MANNAYTPTPATGTTYVRAKQLVLNNPLNAANSVTVFEEIVVQLNGGTVQQDKGAFTVVVDDMSRTVQMLDPTTGQPTGETMPYGKVYQAMYSAYISWAMQRDDGQVPA